jgi:hypothetical protein
MNARPLSAIAVLLLCSVVPHAPRIPVPRLVLWAWERPEDLRFIDPKTTGVAYLAATLSLQPDGSLKYHFRQQSLKVPEAVARIAVVRIESPSRYVFPDAAKVAPGIASVTQFPHVVALQIDYDARASERPFYRALLVELRKNTNLPIGITALASWCDGDSWLAGEPISEAVPMFFRMGRNESKGMPVHAQVCRASIGLSTDEQWPPHRPPGLRNGSRIYVFNPHVWTEVEYAAIVARTEVWK